MDSTRRRLQSVLVPIAAVLALACAGSGTPEPVIETGDRAEVISGGLYRIRNSGFANAWVKPGVAFSDYDSVTLAAPLIAYKRNPRSQAFEFSNTSNYALDDDQIATYKKYFENAFEDQFVRSEEYELVATPRAGTLIIVPAIMDLVVEARPDRTRVYDSFSTSTARMTLVIDLRDAASGEVLARFAERRAARTPGAVGTNAVYASNPVSSAAALRTTFGHWARALRTYLAHVHQLPPLEVAQPGNG